MKHKKYAAAEENSDRGEFPRPHLGRRGAERGVAQALVTLLVPEKVSPAERSPPGEASHASAGTRLREIRG